MNTSSENNTSTCANCGKGEEAGTNLKSCAACILVKYCSRDCQIAHRPQHKKECKKRAKELHDEKLFEQPPPDDDCPICMVRLPALVSGHAFGRTYMSCCGKIICNGCVHAYQSRAIANGRTDEDDICPFCRAPPVDSDEENIKRLEKRMDLNDANAIFILGYYYSNGQYGLSQNHTRALELWQRAAELGCNDAYNNIGSSYKFGRGVERNEKKAIYYLELAAMNGCTNARCKLGSLEMIKGSVDRALNHWMIAAKSGNNKAVESIKVHCMDGRMKAYTKDDYMKALRAYQEYFAEIKTDQRVEAAAV